MKSGIRDRGGKKGSLARETITKGLESSGSGVPGSQKTKARSARKTIMQNKIATPVRYFRTVETPAEAEAAVMKYWAKLHSQEAANDRTREIGIPALKRLFELVETRDSGQIKIIASVLAACYNGRGFRVNLQCFRVLDAVILDDVLAVIRMDSSPSKEVHEYFLNGNERFQKMIKKFGLVVSKDE